MNAGPTSTRIYEALRTQLLQRNHRPGSKLDPSLLADELGSSTTPVRDALHILAGEDLVIALPVGGFTTAWLDERSLFDLYAWNADILTAALRDQRLPMIASTLPALTMTGSDDLADRIGDFFQRIADGSSNPEHGRAQTRTNARLHGARMAEVNLLSDSGSSLESMKNSFELRNFSELRTLIKIYTTRRKRLSGKILRHIQREALI